MVVRKIERHRQEERRKEVKKACYEWPSGRSTSLVVSRLIYRIKWGNEIDLRS